MPLGLHSQIDRAGLIERNAVKRDNSRSQKPLRQLARSLKMSTGHFLYAPSGLHFGNDSAGLTDRREVIPVLVKREGLSVKRYSPGSWHL